jgi:hypothetical protein
MSNEVETNANNTVEKINESAMRDILVAAQNMKHVAERLLSAHAALMKEIKEVECGTDIQYACWSICSTLTTANDTLGRELERVELARHGHEHLTTLSTVFGRNVCGLPLVERAKETIAIYAE